MFKELIIILSATSIVRTIKAPVPFLSPVPVYTATNTVFDSTRRLHNRAASPKVFSYQNQYFSPKSTYEINPANVKTVPAPVPLVSKSFSTVQFFGSANANQRFAVYSASAPSGPEPLAASAAPYYTPPVAARTVNTESRGAVQFDPSPAYNTQDARKAVSVQSHGEVQSQSGAVATYPTNAVVNSPAAQYAPASPVSYATNPAVRTALSAIPAAPKSVLVASYNSVSVHPAPKYAAAPALVKNVPVPVLASNPIPVPIFYQNSAVQPQQSQAQQFAVAPTAATYAQSPVRAQSYSLPSQYQANSDIRYQPAPVRIVQDKSFVQKVYAPENPTPAPVAPASQKYVDYARAIQYSPASSVSHVSFNGLGVSYKW